MNGSSMMSSLSKAASNSLSLGQSKAQALSGGRRKRRHKRSMRGGSGGYNGTSSSGGVAANAASYSSSGYNQGGLGDLGGTNGYINNQSAGVRALYAGTGGRRRKTMRKRSRDRHSKRRTTRGFMGLFKY